MSRLAVNNRQFLVFIMKNVEKIFKMKSKKIIACPTQKTLTKVEEREKVKRKAGQSYQKIFSLFVFFDKNKGKFCGD